MLTTSIARLGRAITKELRARRGVRQLAQMNDRMLADIGLTRSDIRDAARGLPRPGFDDGW